MDVKIITLNDRAEGVAKHKDGQDIFIPYTLQGEDVSIKISENNRFGYNALPFKVNVKSEDRVSAPCTHFGTCGGCKLQHMSEDFYKKFKKSIVENALQKNDLADQNVLEPILLPEKSRRRCKLIAKKIKNNIHLGFRGYKSHDIVTIKECHVIVPELENLLKPLQKMSQLILDNKQQADIYLSYTEGNIDVLIDLPKVEKFLDYTVREELASLAQQHSMARLTLKTKDMTDQIYLQKQPMVKFNHIPISVNSRCFLQASNQADMVLQKQVTDYLKDKNPTKIADLFCGRGTFSFAFKNSVKVDGFEADKPALEALNQAAKKYKPNVQGHYLNLYQEPLTSNALNNYDAVILDPPRDGAFKQCAEISKSDVKDIVYISCNPFTFARDAKILQNGGYKISPIQPVDQFLWSSHIEVIAHFEK